MEWFNIIKQKIKKIQQCFDSSRINLLNKLKNNFVYDSLKKKREWIMASFRNYAFFLLWGSISLASIRYFQMWITNSWHLINFYYTSVAFSFFVTFVLISLRYLKDKGYFKRGEENREKWRAYQQFVAEKHKLKWNFIFSRSLPLLLTLDFLFLNFYRDSHVSETLSNIGMFTSSFVFFCYAINHFYIFYWMRKTPTPQELLLDPPNMYVKIASIPAIDKILSRRYSTLTRAERLRLFYSTNKKEIWATGVGVATVMYWATGTDRTIADYNEETSYGSRVYTTSKGGWYTTDPKIKTRAHQLIRWGVDPSELCYENSKRLNSGEVNTVYERLKDEKYPKPYKLELQNLKSNLEATKLELNDQKRRNEDLERRLSNLEKLKEIEYK